MKSRVRSFLLAAAAASALTVSATLPVFADDDGWGWGHGMMGRWFYGEMMGHGGMGGWGPGMMMGKRFTTERLEALKKELAITDAQKKLWDDYVSVLQASQEAMRAAHLKMMQSGFPEKLPDRLTMHEEMMTARLESMKAVNAATRALYDSMSPEQKAKADDMIAGMGMM